MVLRDGVGGALQLGADRRAPDRAASAVGPRGRRRGGPASLQHPRHPVQRRRGRLHRRRPDPARSRRALARWLRLPRDGGQPTSAGSSASCGRGTGCASSARSRAAAMREPRRARPGALGRAPTRRGAGPPRGNGALAAGSGRGRHLPAQRRRQPARRVRRHDARPRAADAGRRARRGDRRETEAAGVARAHAGDPLAAGQARPRPAAPCATRSDLVAGLEDELPATGELAVPTRIVELPLSWDDPATRAGDRALHGRRARRRAVVPVEHRVHPARQRARRPSRTSSASSSMPSTSCSGSATSTSARRWRRRSIPATGW